MRRSTKLYAMAVSDLREMEKVIDLSDKDNIIDVEVVSELPSKPLNSIVLAKPIVSPQDESKDKSNLKRIQDAFKKT